MIIDGEICMKIYPIGLQTAMGYMILSKKYVRESLTTVNNEVGLHDYMRWDMNDYDS